MKLELARLEHEREMNLQLYNKRNSKRDVVELSLGPLSKLSFTRNHILEKAIEMQGYKSEEHVSKKLRTSDSIGTTSRVFGSSLHGGSYTEHPNDNADENRLIENSAEAQEDSTSHTVQDASMPSPISDSNVDDDMYENGSEGDDKIKKLEGKNKVKISSTSVSKSPNLQSATLPDILTGSMAVVTAGILCGTKGKVLGYTHSGDSVRLEFADENGRLRRTAVLRKNVTALTNSQTAQMSTGSSDQIVPTGSLTSAKSNSRSKSSLAKYEGPLSVSSAALPSSTSVSGTFCFCGSTQKGLYIKCNSGISGCNGMVHPKCTVDLKDKTLEELQNIDTKDYVCFKCRQYLSTSIDYKKQIENNNSSFQSLNRNQLTRKRQLDTYNSSFYPQHFPNSVVPFPNANGNITANSNTLQFPNGKSGNSNGLASFTKGSKVVLGSGPYAGLQATVVDVLSNGMVTVSLSNGAAENEKDSNGDKTNSELTKLNVPYHVSTKTNLLTFDANQSDLLSSSNVGFKKVTSSSSNLPEDIVNSSMQSSKQQNIAYNNFMSQNPRMYSNQVPTKKVIDIMNSTKSKMGASNESDHNKSTTQQSKIEPSSGPPESSDAIKKEKFSNSGNIVDLSQADDNEFHSTNSLSLRMSTATAREFDIEISKWTSDLSKALPALFGEPVKKTVSYIHC